jgi:hypothetical protein
MRIRANLVCASILLAGFVPALLGQTPSKPAAALPSASGHPPLSTETSGSPPAETPANPPEVTFHDGLLSIRAENSTLGDVLRAVQNATGASIESPGLTNERVYVKLGPGEPRNILASLLNGSHYDYILLGSRQQPNSVARVMLTVRQSSREQPAAPTAAARSTPPPPPANNDDVDTTDTQADRIAPPVQVNQPPPGQPPGQNAQDASQQQPGQPASGQGPKTPEQLLQQLQQMRQQQQQQFQLQQQLQQQNNWSR